MNRFNGPRGPIATRAVYIRAHALAIGEHFTVSLREWKSATPPTETLAKNRRYEGQFDVRELADGKGLVITRVK